LEQRKELLNVVQQILLVEALLEVLLPFNNEETIMGLYEVGKKKRRKKRERKYFQMIKRNHLKLETIKTRKLVRL
jgi:hypothetical protein